MVLAQECNALRHCLVLECRVHFARIRGIPEHALNLGQDADIIKIHRLISIQGFMEISRLYIRVRKHRGSHLVVHRSKLAKWNILRVERDLQCIIGQSVSIRMKSCNGFKTAHIAEGLHDSVPPGFRQVCGCDEGVRLSEAAR